MADSGTDLILEKLHDFNLLDYFLFLNFFWRRGCMIFFDNFSWFFLYFFSFFFFFSLFFVEKIQVGGRKAWGVDQWEAWELIMGSQPLPQTLPLLSPMMFFANILQSQYYRRMGTNTRKMNIGRWKKMFSIILTDYSLDCWKSRNESIHGKEQDISRKKILIPYIPRYGAYTQGRENFMDIQTKRSLRCHW